MAEGAGVWIYPRGERFQLRVRAEPGGAFAYESFASRDAAEARAAECRALLAKQRAGEGLPPLEDKVPLAELGYVYFVRAGNGPIKIGFSRNVEARMAELRTGSAEELHLMATFRGTVEDERHMHDLFSDFRLRREWFRPDPELLDFIKRLR